MLEQMKKLQHVIREGLITKFVREGVIISEDVKDISEIEIKQILPL